MRNNGVAEQERPAAEVLNTRIIEVVGREIVSGILPPGRRLTLVGLQEQFGVSRTVVRDSVQILEAMNLVYSKRRVGIVVLDPARWNVYDPRIIRWKLDGPGHSRQFRSLTELRIAVEPLAAAGAARSATEGQRRDLQDLAARMHRSAEDPEDFLKADVAFHTLLLQASGNEMFASLGSVFAEVIPGGDARDRLPGGPQAEALELHSGVADAVARADPAAARLHMAALLADVEETLRQQS